jgi:hypothetical protein
MNNHETIATNSSSIRNETETLWVHAFPRQFGGTLFHERVALATVEGANLWLPISG